MGESCGNCSHGCCCNCRRKTCRICSRHMWWFNRCWGTVCWASRYAYKPHFVCFPCRNVYKCGTAGYKEVERDMERQEKRLKHYEATGNGESEAAIATREFLQRMNENYNGGKCARCGENGTCVPKSFRAPPKSDDAGWKLVKRLVCGNPSENFPEFKRARPGTLAYRWENLASFQHAPEPTWEKMWYPTHDNQVSDWVKFMMTTRYWPDEPPAYTKAQKAKK
jgi:hypothetical protein